MPRARTHSIRLGEKGTDLLRVFEEMYGDSYSSTVGKALHHYARLQLELPIWNETNQETRHKLITALNKPGR